MADDEARIVSVIGGAKRTSRWRIAEDTSVLTLFGRCLLDLREAETEAGELWFSVASVFATVEIIVPEGTIVQPSGMALLGASTCEVPASRRVSPLPAIEIDNITVFGRLRIHVGQRPPRVGLLRRLFRRGAELQPASTVVAGDADTSDDGWDVEGQGPSLVDELLMGEPSAGPAEADAAPARTDMNELDAVLAGTHDKPAVRRRAVVSLAAFEGPEVDAALRRALGDRDWQVRQAAEDLLEAGGDAEPRRTADERNRARLDPNRPTAPESP